MLIVGVNNAVISQPTIAKATLGVKHCGPDGKSAIVSIDAQTGKISPAINERKPTQNKPILIWPFNTDVDSKTCSVGATNNINNGIITKTR